MLAGGWVIRREVNDVMNEALYVRLYGKWSDGEVGHGEYVIDDGKVEKVAVIQGQENEN
jgi:hypothetical protein